jgi:hypothetical protein
MTIPTDSTDEPAFLLTPMSIPFPLAISTVILFPAKNPAGFIRSMRNFFRSSR